MTIEQYCSETEADYETVAERAAIIEYDGGWTREKAEELAMALHWARMAEFRTETGIG